MYYSIKLNLKVTTALKTSKDWRKQRSRVVQQTISTYNSLPPKSVTLYIGVVQTCVLTLLK